LRLFLVSDIKLDTEELFTLTERSLGDFRIASSRNDGIAAPKSRTSDLQAESTRRSGNEPNK
jgi:hypothetical protein